MEINILKFDLLASTNSEALEQARHGAKEGLCVVAEQQDAGRGRHGRTWVSRKGSGLYFSIVLRPKIETKFLPLITLMTAVVIYDVLQKLCLIKADIKWSNDILVNEKKICGILAETTDSSEGIAVIVGIGINLDSENFPKEIMQKATSIEQEINKKINLDELLNSITRTFGEFYELLKGENGAAKIRKEWAKRSSYFENKKVRAILENEIIYGTTCGIEKNGALRIKEVSGEVRIIQAGDIEKLREE